MSSMYRDYYDELRCLISQGWYCRGESCSGWVCSDLDTIERCGCGNGTDANHPEYGEAAQEARAEVECPIRGEEKTLSEIIAGLDAARAARVVVATREIDPDSIPF